MPSLSTWPATAPPWPSRRACAPCAADQQLTALTAAGAAAAALVEGDATRAAGAAGLVAAAEAALGGLDALVYAASGPFVPQQPQAISEESWDASMDTIAKGFFFSACAAHDRLSTGGAIVAITDYLGLQPWATFAAARRRQGRRDPPVKELARAWAPDGRARLRRALRAGGPGATTSTAPRPSPPP